MQDSQRMYIEYDEFSVLRSAPPANLIIDSGSEMWASADFKIIGAASTAFEVLYHKTIFVAFLIHYLKVCFSAAVILILSVKPCIITAFVYFF